MSSNELKNKNEEMRLAKLFCGLNGEIFNKNYILEPFEKPDILIQYGDKTIGLELTRLPNPHNPEQSIFTDFIKRICSKLTEKINSEGYLINGSLMLKYPNSKLNIKEENKLVEYLFDQIKTDYDSLDYKKQYPPKWNLDLMYPISTFMFNKVQNKELSQFTPSDSVILPFLTSEIIQDVINKKNKLLKGYKKFNENWLLIHFGHDFSDEFSQSWKNTLFELTSDFNRVYLLDERLNGFSKMAFKM